MCNHWYYCLNVVGWVLSIYEFIYSLFNPFVVFFWPQALSVNLISPICLDLVFISLCPWVVPSICCHVCDCLTVVYVLTFSLYTSFSDGQVLICRAFHWALVLYFHRQVFKSPHPSTGCERWRHFPCLPAAAHFVFGCQTQLSCAFPLGLVVLRSMFAQILNVTKGWVFSGHFGLVDFCTSLLGLWSRSPLHVFSLGVPDSFFSASPLLYDNGCSCIQADHSASCWCYW